MRVSFVYPTGQIVTGGNAVLYQFANGLARLGHEVNFLHGPKMPGRLETLGDLPEMCIGHGVTHHLIDELTDPVFPSGDVIFNQAAPRRLGLPATIVQGYRMLSDEMERISFIGPGIKCCVASWLVDVGLEMGAPSTSLVHVPPGLDHDCFRLRRPIQDRPIDVTFMYHGHREKGWAVGLEAMDRLLNERPELNVVVFGRVEPPRLAPSVTFRQSLSAEVLAEEVYNRTRIFVQSSRHEGFGLCAIESMACGSALVTTDCGGSRDYAFDGETARVVPTDDAVGLALAIGELLDDEPKRRAVATGAMKYVARFQWDQSSALLASALEAYIAEPESIGVPLS